MGVFSYCLGQQSAVEGGEHLEEDLQFLGQLVHHEELLVDLAELLLAKINQDFGQLTTEE